ncbi:hypothetical protein NXX44_13335 [Bacteroides ovatus]|nr:hypothetical protein [Bacteroides ovatus]UVQ62282.1 hypothetical protein NXX44_13335 [Bacteroides ovatus]
MTDRREVIPWHISKLKDVFTSPAACLRCRIKCHSKLPFRCRSNTIQGGIAKVYDVEVLKVRPFLDTGHGSDGSGFGSVHRYHAQLFHRCKEIADSFSPYVPFLRESGFRELELSGLQFLRPAE